MPQLGVGERDSGRAGGAAQVAAPGRLLRGAGLSLAVILLLLAAVAACGSDEGSGDDATAVSGSPTRGNDGPDVVMSTFTPTPPDHTPEAVQTADALRTQQASSPTAGTTTPSDGSPQPGEPTPTPAPNEVRSPEVRLVTAAGDLVGAIGSFNWYDAELDSGGKFDVPYVFLPNGTVDWPQGTTARLEVPDSPYAVRSATISIYTFDDNVAIPTNEQGNPITGGYAFLPQQDPLQREELTGATIETGVDVPPGNYIVEARVVWDGPAEVEQSIGELYTQYVFVVTVL